MERESPFLRRLNTTGAPPANQGSAWWVLWTGFADGARNMAVDEWLMTTAGRRPPTLRLYGWRYPTVSLGRNERWRPVVQPTRLAQAHVRLVRRPTGGRAVLHHRELTYSVTASVERDPALGLRLEETLEKIAGALTCGLARIGVSASARRRREPLGRQEGPCFESTTRFELLAARGKVVGSAQYRTAAAFLQHGSIPAYPTLRDLYALGGGKKRAPKEENEPENWASLAPVEIGKALALGFAEGFHAPLLFKGLETIDWDGVANLERRRYAHAEWTFRR